jgi:hypothetical protein
MVATLVPVTAIAPALADVNPPGGFVEPNFVNTTLEGCRADTAAYLPGTFICPDGDYTTGNLGKGWNELDLVPHRLTTSLGSQATATTDYNIIIAADNSENASGTPEGYDFISVPQVNAAKSDSSCAVTFVGDQAEEIGLTGGVYDGIYRIIGIHQDKGTTCVFDWVKRLSITAADFSGSSLQAYKFDAADFNTGKKTVPIPVGEVLPQSISKTMTATQDSSHTWALTKTASPVSLNFGNSCDLTGGYGEEPVSITISWTKLPASQTGNITVLTTISASNPSRRDVQINLTDVIYGVLPGSGGVETVLDTEVFDPIIVPANTDTTIATHIYEAPDGTTGLRDVATATYTDVVFPDVPIPGDTTAEASATVTSSGVVENAFATVTDTESISGAGLDFKVAAPSSGSFTNYTAGDWTTGPVDWTSGLNAISDSGSITFNKVVRAAKGTIEPNGLLSDTATLNGSDGFGPVTQSAQTSITVDTKADLTIDKTIPNVLQGAETASFDFKVTGPGGFDQTVTLSFAAGETSKSTTLMDLVPGIYNVNEQPQTGWVDADGPGGRNVDLSGAICDATTSYTNALVPATAKVIKVTDPAGNEAGWEFTLAGPGGPETKSTGALGTLTFDLALQEGDYTVTETEQGGFDLVKVTDPDGSTSDLTCQFSVNYPADADSVFECTFENRERGSLQVTKVVDWNGVTPDETQTFEICITGPSYPTPDCKIADYDGAVLNWSDLIPGDYTVTETDPGTSWIVTGSPQDVAVEAGSQGTATVTNTRKLGSLDVTKAVVWNGVTPVDGTTFEICIEGPSYPLGTEVGACQTATYPGDLELSWDNLIPGDYTVTETFPGNEWTVVITGSPATVPTDGGSASATVTNTRKLGSLKVTKAVNWSGAPPDTSQTFEICIQGPSYPTTPNCKTADYDGGVLTWSDLIPGEYTVTETALGDAWTVNITGSPADVPTDGGTATATVNNTYRPGMVEILKLTNGEVVGPDVMTWTFTLAGPGIDGAISDSQDANGIVDFGGQKLYVGATYTVCETGIPPSWTSMWVMDVNGDGVYNPDDGDYVLPFVGGEADLTGDGLLQIYDPDPNYGTPDAVNDTRCVNFQAGPDETVNFIVDNQRPGGEPRTPGYWKNWSSCSGGGQYDTAQINGGSATGWWTLDDLLPQLVGDQPVGTCEDGVNLLNKSDLRGKKRANDAAYNLVTALLAAKLNVSAGACQPDSAQMDDAGYGEYESIIDVVAAADDLLIAVDFDGYGSYLSPKETKKDPQKTQAQTALTLAGILDAYNNSMICTGDETH